MGFFDKEDKRIKNIRFHETYLPHIDTYYKNKTIDIISFAISKPDWNDYIFENFDFDNWAFQAYKRRWLGEELGEIKKDEKKKELQRAKTAIESGEVGEAAATKIWKWKFNEQHFKKHAENVENIIDSMMFVMLYEEHQISIALAKKVDGDENEKN